VTTRTAKIAVPLIAIAALAPVAVEAAIPRPSPISPKNRATLPVGKTPTFTVRSTGEGTVWVHVSKSARKSADGVIRHDAFIGQARRKSRSTFSVKPKYYDYPGFWAGTARKWYWQSFRIACGEESSSNDCKVEGPVRSFTLR
jgi:hypothetical protein